MITAIRLSMDVAEFGWLIAAAFIVGLAFGLALGIAAGGFFRSTR